MRHVRTRSAPPASWRTALAGLLIGLGIAFALSYAMRPAVPPSPERAVETRLSPEAGRIFERGRNLLRDGHFREGLAALEEAAKQAPESAEVLHVTGQANLLLKRFEPAAGYLKRALEREPNRVRAMTDLAYALRELGQAEEAVAIAERAAALAPGERKIQVLLGQNLLRANEPRRAAAVFESLVAGGGADASDHLALARARDLLDDRPAAEAGFQKAIALDAGAPLAHFWYAQHLLRVGKRDLAQAEIAAYRKASALQTRLNQLEQKVQIEPGNAHRWAELASALVERGDPKRAQQALGRAAQLAPDSADVRSVRTVLERKEKQHE